MKDKKVRENIKRTRVFLRHLESKLKKTSEHEISDEIGKFIKEEFNQNPPQVLKWEKMAFDFKEDYPKERSTWGTYYGPMFVLADKEGKIIEYPSIKDITLETLSYWEKRAEESKHPIFKARYSDLVWDFSEKIKGGKANYSIAQIFIDSIIEIAKQDLCKFAIDTIKKLERALTLALIINDKERIEKLKQTIIQYEDKIAEDESPGLWGFSYELLVKNKKVKLSDEEERKIIKDLEERFERLLKGNNLWAAKCTADDLADYYWRRGKCERIRNILLKLEKMTFKVFGKASPLILTSWLEGLYHTYRQYGLKEEADKLSAQIKELGKKGLDELKEIEVRVEISKEEFNEFINQLIKGDIKSALERIAIYFIPKKDEALKELKDISQTAPFFSHLPKKTIDFEGRVISTLGSIEDDISGNLISQISQDMSFVVPFLRETIHALIKKFNLTAKSIVDYLYESPVFDERKKEFLVRGIDAYLKGDFLVALHILIPQIEAVIRNLAEKIGVPILKRSRVGGFNYRLLDDLLRDENICKVLTEDFCLYLRTLLTDPRGWNLRNNLCHGISHIHEFNYHTADRIFHVLLYLALIKEEKNE